SFSDWVYPRYGSYVSSHSIWFPDAIAFAPASTTSSLSMASAMSARMRSVATATLSISSFRAMAVHTSWSILSRKLFIVSLLYLATTGDLVGVRGAESAVERGMFVELSNGGDGCGG